MVNDYGKVMRKEEEMVDKALFSSANGEWETPQELFDELDKEFRFTLDVCASPHNAKCKMFLVDGFPDALAVPWEGVCWMNPPYGRNIGQWIQKAYIASKNGATVVCLLPSRTDTRWWHNYCMKGEIRFIRGRLKFGGSKTGAPFPSAIVIFKQTSREI